MKILQDLMEMYVAMLGLLVCLIACLAATVDFSFSSMRDLPSAIIEYLLEVVKFTYQMIVLEFWAVKLAGAELALIALTLTVAHWPTIWQTTLTGAALASAVAL